MSEKRRSARPRAVIIHGIAHARAAAAQASALGVPVCLRSAPGAGGYAGAPWFREIVAVVRAEYPDTDIRASLDCADQPGTALAALRDGVTLIRLRGRTAVKDKVAAIARTYGAALDDDRRKALDLAAEDDPDTACRAWLIRDRPRLAD